MLFSRHLGFLFVAYYFFKLKILCAFYGLSFVKYMVWTSVLFSQNFVGSEREGCC